MGLFPQSFLDDLRTHADLVQIVQQHVPLKRAGASYKGLCPFHAEKTPSFHVNGDRGFFRCFGCGAGGDVFKFLELHERLSFPEAVRQLAGRLGVPVPEADSAGGGPADTADREALLKAHQLAADFFREQLAGPAGSRARQQLRDRGLTEATVDALKIGYAPQGRDGLTGHLLNQGFEPSLLVRSGLSAEREGQLVDRFRQRLVFPICRDSGSVIAFGGRAIAHDQQPKYLNSPETAIYVKGRTLYGLHLSKAAISRTGYAVIVEGYFDFAQAFQHGVQAVVASCGTALTSSQARLLKRFAPRAVLSFDPDAAGQGAAEKSCELLVAEGFQVNVALLPVGQDPDAFIRQQGGAAYHARLRGSRPYLEYLLDRAVQRHEMTSDAGRRQFLRQMLEVAARVPDAAARDQFADRIAHRARVTEAVVRAEIRRAAVDRRTTIPSGDIPGQGHVRPAERGLIWAIINEPAAALPVLDGLGAEDLEGLATESILRMARSLVGWPVELVPQGVVERLSTAEARLAREIAADPVAPAPAAECGRALKRLSLERERAVIQREIDRLQEEGVAGHSDEIDTLWHRKRHLVDQIESLSA